MNKNNFIDEFGNTINIDYNGNSIYNNANLQGHNHNNENSKNSTIEEKILYLRRVRRIQLLIYLFLERPSFNRKYSCLYQSAE